MTTTTKVSGLDAIQYARIAGVELHKYEDPIEPELRDIGIEYATEIAREDPGLVYVEADPDDVYRAIKGVFRCA